MLILCCTWTKIITNTTEQIKFEKTKTHVSTDMSLQISRCDSFTNSHEIALDLKKQRKILEENKVIGFIRSGDYIPSAFKAKKQALFLVPLITHCYLVNSNV